MRLNKLTDQKNLLGEYLDIIENLKNYSQHTVVAYKTDINQFFEFMNNTETIDIEKFIQNLARNNYSKTTLNRKIASLTTFLNWCSREKGITVPETYNLAVLKTDKKLPNIMTSNYINTLLDNIPVSSTKEIRDRAIIEIPRARACHRQRAQAHGRGWLEGGLLPVRRPSLAPSRRATWKSRAASGLR